MSRVFFAKLFTLLSVLIIPVTTEVHATTYSYTFETGSPRCVTQPRCRTANDRFIGIGDGSRLKPLIAEVVLDDAFVPGGTLTNSVLSWRSEIGFDGLLADPFPAWLVSFDTNYDGGFQVPYTYTIQASLYIEFDRFRQISVLEVYRWLIRENDLDLRYDAARGIKSALLSFDCEASMECERYQSWFAPVPLPPAVLPFLAALTLLGGGTALRRTRSA